MHHEVIIIMIIITIIIICSDSKFVNQWGNVLMACAMNMITMTKILEFTSDVGDNLLMARNEISDARAMHTKILINTMEGEIDVRSIETNISKLLDIE